MANEANEDLTKRTFQFKLAISQLWALLVALVVIITGAFGLGFYISSLVAEAKQASYKFIIENQKSEIRNLNKKLAQSTPDQTKVNNLAAMVRFGSI